MAAPVFFIDPSDVVDVGGTLIVTGPEGHHAAQVTRLRVGEAVELVDGVGRRVAGQVSGVAKDRIDVSVASVAWEAEPDPRIIVVQALPKGDRAERAVELMTEVGVDVIVPWSADHCVVRWTKERSDKGLAKWRQAARASAKQSRRARVPLVTHLHITEDLERLMAEASLSVILDEGAAEAFVDIAIPSRGDIVLVVGPEGGMSERERAQLVAGGAIAARLGPTVLRTSTAGAVAAAVVASRTPLWGTPPATSARVPG
jgi:16S rRNA (uracil1498-N3)-methyltransferase